MAAAVVYSFPLLPAAEISTCLSELGIEFSEAALSKPEPEPVAKLFEELVVSQMGVTRDELQQPVFAALDALTYPELHEESVGVIAFTRHLHRLVRTAGITDFSMRDVYAPEAKRLQRCLSAVLNFAKYREDMVAQWQELRDGSRAAAAAVTAAKQAHAEKREELARIAAARAADAPRVAALEAEIAELQNRLSALADEQEALDATVRDLKAEGHDVADKLAATKQAVQAARAESDALRAKIVDAPEREEGALAEMRAAVERERQRSAAAEAQLRELNARVEQLAFLEKDVRKAVALMGEVSAAVAQRKEASAVLKAARAQMADNEAETWRLESEREHLQRTLATMAERQARLEQQGELKRETAMAHLRAAQEEHAAAREHGDAAADRAAATAAEARNIEAATAELRRKHARDMASVAARYATLRESVEEYHMRLADCIDGPLDADTTDAEGEKENEDGDDGAYDAAAAAKLAVVRASQTPAAALYAAPL